MKKLLVFLMFILIMSLLLCSCGLINYQIKTEIYNNENVIIEYPVIKSIFKDHDVFNHYIREYASKIYNDLVNDYDDLDYVEIKYNVFMDENLISVLFEGEFSYSSSAHPTNVVYSLNYSIDNNTIIMFDEFFNNLSTQTIIQACVNNENAFDLYDANSLSDLIEEFDNFGSQFCFYKNSEGKYVTLIAPHSVGDYIKIRVD